MCGHDRSFVFLAASCQKGPGNITMVIRVILSTVLNFHSNQLLLTLDIQNPENAALYGSSTTNEVSFTCTKSYVNSVFTFHLLVMKLSEC